MTVEEIRLVFDGLQLLGLIGVWIYAVMTRRSKDNTSALVSQGGKLQKVEKDLLVIGETLKHAPNDKDVALLHKRISGVKDQVADIFADVSGIKATVASIDRSIQLLNRAKIGDGA